MHDLKDIRANPETFDSAMARRALPAQSPAILALDEKRRAAQTALQELQSQRNEKSKLIGQLKAKKENADAAMAEVAALKDKMTALEGEEKEIGDKLTDLLSRLPNILADDVPDGRDEDSNVEIRRVGTPAKTGPGHPDHVAIGEALGQMDFDVAAKLSGARFVLMHSGLARLERALAQFMLDTHTAEHGYTEVSPPLLVKSETMYGTGQLPKFGEDLFQTTRGDWLIPTAEVSLTNMVADMIVEESTLPRRYTAHTPCFRSEAGAAGKDTKGMIRQHQFYKVEMVSITRPEDSVAEHERMTKCAESVLTRLGLPFRTIVLCSGDTGFGARKTYDIEVWLPGQDRYREISSCSNCGDFQARRMKARTKRPGEKDTCFVHTLNGSGVAVGRALIAVLENYWDPARDAVVVPEVLRPYMGGLTEIAKNQS
ncbi:MAG: serine--tRNA ligase [Rhodospirillales bacterium]|nr:serine--tRNA ligase [Alphaproteobacteria bacterium]MCB9986017.1 serine--tRNA ligase [Rhodospirillales bacterium]USO07408.1 MAG: serine--tRNA ligase [Rhodospirillales bacterium]